MGFWTRVKDVLASGPTTAVKNERAEDAVERATRHLQPKWASVVTTPHTVMQVD